MSGTLTALFLLAILAAIGLGRELNRVASARSSEEREALHRAVYGDLGR